MEDELPPPMMFVIDRDVPDHRRAAGSETALEAADRTCIRHDEIADPDRLAVRVGDCPGGKQSNAKPGVRHTHFRARVDGEDTPARFHRLVRPFHLVEIGGVCWIDITVARLEPIAVAEPLAGIAILVRALERRIRREEWRLSLAEIDPECACGFVDRVGACPESMFRRRRYFSRLIEHLPNGIEQPAVI